MVQMDFRYLWSVSCQQHCGGERSPQQVFCKTQGLSPKHQITIRTSKRPEARCSMFLFFVLFSSGETGSLDYTYSSS